MGYPMTYDRVLRRNGLASGDYGSPDEARPFPPESKFPSHEAYMRALENEIRMLRQDLARRNNKMRMLKGDLRRLETDARDESAICRHIVERTGADADTVAAVLKAFITL
jgi:hypothetical protein